MKLKEESVADEISFSSNTTTKLLLILKRRVTSSKKGHIFVCIHASGNYIAVSWLMYKYMCISGCMAIIQKNVCTTQHNTGVTSRKKNSTELAEQLSTKASYWGLDNMIIYLKLSISPCWCNWPFWIVYKCTYRLLKTDVAPLWEDGIFFSLQCHAVVIATQQKVCAKSSANPLWCQTLTQLHTQKSLIPSCHYLPMLFPPLYTSYR